MVIGQSLNELLARSFAGRSILITGHNGFVGSWLSLLLSDAGASVTGLALPAPAESLADDMDLDALVDSRVADVVDANVVEQIIDSCSPEIVFHLAAQPLVLESYRDPVRTFATNVMGTAHVLDALRRQTSVRACVVVTSDKCYATADHAHTESDPLGGDDPYSASKAAEEMVATAFRHSYFSDGSLALATTRAGNILGGGDWADDRIVPDLARAVRGGTSLVLRRPDAVRPWQHVLEAVAGYVRLADALLVDPDRAATAWNFGPPADAAATVGRVVESMIGKWRTLGAFIGDPILEAANVPERTVLTLDSTRARQQLGWEPMLDLDATLSWTVDWYARALVPGFDARMCTRSQISEYLKLDEDAAKTRTAATSREASSAGTRP